MFRFNCLRSLLNFRNLYSTVQLNANANTINTLNAGQVAFVNRLGLERIPAAKLALALSYPKLTKNSDPAEFDNLVQIGNQALVFFTREYLQSRFPALKEQYLEVGMKMFLADRNLLGLAKFLGIEAACGIDLLRTEEIKSFKKKKKQRRAEDSESQMNYHEIELKCFKAILGSIAIEAGPQKLRSFLDSRYFNNSLFNPKDLVRPLYPIPDLTQLYPDLVFRLHQESGRLSNDSMFIVGVYADKTAEKCLGEGYGASQALAQHRAATEALRSLYLVEKRIGRRPSDDIQSISKLLANNS